MNPKQIHLFFTELDQQLGLAADIIVTGAAAAALMGYGRPSLDVDFEIRVKRGRKMNRAKRIHEAIARTRRKVGIAAQYSEDIDRWSMIQLLDYRKKAVPYKKIGKLDVCLMSPEHWTLGKLNRYLILDIRDMIRVIKGKRLSHQKLIRLWARALKESDLSLHSQQFRDHAIHFISHYGKKIWRNFDVDRAVRQFRKSAGITQKGSDPGV